MDHLHDEGELAFSVQNLSDIKFPTSITNT